MDFRSSSTEIWRRWWWRSSGWLCRCSPEERHRATWRETKTHPIFKVHLFLLISSISEVLDFRYFKHIFLNYYFCDFWFSPSLLWTSDFELRIFQVSLPTFELRIFLVVLSSQDQIGRFRLFCWRSTMSVKKLTNRPRKNRTKIPLSLQRRTGGGREASRQPRESQLSWWQGKSRIWTLFARILFWIWLKHHEKHETSQGEVIGLTKMPMNVLKIPDDQNCRWTSPTNSVRSWRMSRKTWVAEFLFRKKIVGLIYQYC